MIILTTMDARNGYRELAAELFAKGYFTIEYGNKETGEKLTPYEFVTKNSTTEEF